MMFLSISLSPVLAQFLLQLWQEPSSIADTSQKHQRGVTAASPQREAAAAADHISILQRTATSREKGTDQCRASAGLW